MIIGVNYGDMHIGFTYPSIMSAFKEYCLEIIKDDKDNFKLFIQFLWGLKIYHLDELKLELIKMKTLMEKSKNLPLSNECLHFLENDEVNDYLKLKKNNIKFFTAIDTTYFFIDLFIDRIEIAKEEKEEYIAIGSMTVRADMVDEYGWDYPNQIPEEIKKL